MQTQIQTQTMTRLLIGMFATAAALCGGTAGAHAADSPSGPADTDVVPVDSLVCPMITGHGLLAPTMNSLNSESAALSCRA